MWHIEVPSNQFGPTNILDYGELVLEHDVLPYEMVLEQGQEFITD